MGRSKGLRRFPWKHLPQQPVIGVDEVGRGCLAGPVYAAAVILISSKDVRHFTDSKLLSEKRREELAASIRLHQRFGVGIASVEEIETLNIFRASLLAMERAIHALGATSGHILVDGKFKIPTLVGFEQTPLIKGDLRAAPISAASIVAKVARDQFMTEMAREFGVYGFEKHKGYATEVHRQAIQAHGPCSLHRKTFLGVKEFFTPLEPTQGSLL